jgi:hypothetical protein
MRFSETDIDRLIKACEQYKILTGSDWIWDQYEELVKKLKTYRDQYSTEEK